MKITQGIIIITIYLILFINIIITLIKSKCEFLPIINSRLIFFKIGVMIIFNNNNNCTQAKSDFKANLNLKFTKLSNK